MAITLTEKALKELKRIIDEQCQDSQQEQKENVKTFYLRVGAKGGGCAGFEYTMDLTNVEPSEDDEIFPQDGTNITLICDPKSYIYINGTEIDFKEGLLGRGFAFNNPNSTSSCSCGSSFGI